jgi:hypothetical protein
MKKQRIRPGDNLEICLPDGRYAYGKIFNDASIGVYDIVTSTRAVPAMGASFMFVVGVYRDLLTSGKWPRVAHEPFPTPEDAWPPPYAVKDPISGEWSIYHRGNIHPANQSTVAHLEVAAVWDENHIVQRILAGASN